YKLQQINPFEQISDLIDRKNYIVVEEQIATEEMIQRLVQQNMGEAIVVDEEKYYIGTVSLYDALSHQSKPVKQLINTSTITVLEIGITKFSSIKIAISILIFFVLC